MILLAIAAGGFLGAVSRFAISSVIKRRFRQSLPLGTLTVNWAGAFLLGVLLGLEIEGRAYAFLGIGFLGAFTTYSTFMVEALTLGISGERRRAIYYLALSYAGGLAAVFLGLTGVENLF
ncbi:CrcB family protein [Rossellomorea vietnamensis]|uniref:Fluoride-specific ion channel FluC n=1 Tax=Rossellomorea vietnamensis TaxID=218284 RepID=A0A5D4MJE7_9BACI|nr:CrcB family protein [Rossellomorea vietnamensis]TYS01509.1 CrcB family protein [Rossellomorea vietnamensis]